MRLSISSMTVAAGLYLSAVGAIACTGTDLSPGWSPEFRAEVANLAEAQPYPQGRFFEVTKDGASSVLFGTIHLRRSWQAACKQRKSSLSRSPARKSSG